MENMVYKIIKNIIKNKNSRRNTWRLESEHLEFWEPFSCHLIIRFRRFAAVARSITNLLCSNPI
jgi:hypothetical protein